MRVSGRILSVLCLVIGGVPKPALAQECTSVTLNGNCVVVISREAPVTPQPVRVKSNATVTIRVTRRPLEQILFDVAVAETVPVDPIAAIFGAFLKPVSSFVAAQRTFTARAPDRIRSRGADPASRADAFLRDRLLPISSVQTAVQSELRTLDDKFAEAARLLSDFQRLKADAWKVAGLTAFRTDFVCRVLGGREKPDPPVVCTGTSSPLGELALPAGDLLALDGRIEAVLKEYAALPEVVRTEVAPVMNSIATDQAQLRDNIGAVQAKQFALVDAATTVRAIDTSKVKEQTETTIGGGNSRLSRTATVKISVKDLVSKTTTPITTVVIQYGGTRWELSGGALFSALRQRTYQHTPIIENGQPRLDVAGKVQTRITETSTRPVIVPIVVAHYRIAEVVPPGHTQRLAVLWGFGIGVNPYYGSADLATGPTFSYRGFMLSPMLHYGRDLRLTNGLERGQELGSSPPALSTERYVVGKFAIGLSYRIPIN